MSPGAFRRRHGGIERRFTGAERRMIGRLADGVVTSLADDPGSAVTRRLLPDAYPDDPDASAEFADAVRDRLAQAKTEGAERLRDDLQAAPNGLLHLDEGDAVVWLKALGDLRLALAERSGLEEVTRDVRTPQGLIYAWLTWLQGSLVEALDPD